MTRARTTATADPPPAAKDDSKKQEQPQIPFGDDNKKDGS
jgi:hypothetical protein